MTNRFVRLGAAGFALVALSVTFNALFLQRDHLPRRQAAAAAPETRGKAEVRRPSPTAAAEMPIVRPDGWLRLAEMRPHSASLHAGRGADVAGEAVSSTVVAVQRELKLRGYYSGDASGVVDLTTRGAILAFEHDNGLPLAGEPTPELLKSILLGVSAGRDHRVRRDHVDRQAIERVAEIVRFVQLRLNAGNYQPGPVDGVLGSATVRAIREYELDHRMKPTGRISGHLIEKLRAGKMAASGS